MKLSERFLETIEPELSDIRIYGTICLLEGQLTYIEEQIRQANLAQQYEHLASSAEIVSKAFMKDRDLLIKELNKIAEANHL